MPLAEVIENVSLIASATGTVSASCLVCANTVQSSQHIHPACNVTLLLAQCPFQSTMLALCSLDDLAGKSTADLFDRDNRLRLDDWLHQVSAIKDSDEEHSIVGLTFRLGRHRPGRLPPLQCPLAEALTWIAFPCHQPFLEVSHMSD